MIDQEKVSLIELRIKEISESSLSERMKTNALSSLSDQLSAALNDTTYQPPPQYLPDDPSLFRFYRETGYRSDPQWQQVFQCHIHNAETDDPSLDPRARLMHGIDLVTFMGAIQMGYDQ